MKKKASDEKQIDTSYIDSSTQVIYADRLLGVNLSAGTSKLILGNTTASGSYVPTLTLVMPTLSLIDALNNLQKSIHEDEVNKATLLEQIDNFKEKYSNL